MLHFIIVTFERTAFACFAGPKVAKSQVAPAQTHYTLYTPGAWLPRPRRRCMMMRSLVDGGRGRGALN